MNDQIYRRHGGAVPANKLCPNMLLLGWMCWKVHQGYDGMLATRLLIDSQDAVCPDR